MLSFSSLPRSGSNLPVTCSESPGRLFIGSARCSGQLAWLRRWSPLLAQLQLGRLHADELQAVRALLNSERFQDCSPAAIHATLLDESRYFCSTRTMYRILEEDGATRERRDHWSIRSIKNRNCWRPPQPALE